MLWPIIYMHSRSIATGSKNKVHSSFDIIAESMREEEGRLNGMAGFTRS